MLRSWRTTLAGASGLVAVLIQVLAALFARDFNPDHWMVYGNEFFFALGLIFARDEKCGQLQHAESLATIQATRPPFNPN